jgi:hypothetical protein
MVKPTVTFASGYIHHANNEEECRAVLFKVEGHQRPLRGEVVRTSRVLRSVEKNGETLTLVETENTLYIRRGA